MSSGNDATLRALPARLAAVALLGLLVLPAGALLLASSPAQLLAGIRHPLFAPALWLSARTTALSLGVVVVAGTPLAWWLARSAGRVPRVVQLLVDLPIVLPPAVVGVALLQTFGRNGLLGPLLVAVGWQIPFSTAAVVIAQVVVSAPFYVQSAVAAFRRVDPDLMIVARSLGQTASGAFLRVAVPVAIPGLIAGAALAWARSIGEFGATLLFAGSLPGRTRTMPLAILTALESDVSAALAISVVLAAIAVLLLLGLRVAPAVWVPGRVVTGWRAGDGEAES
jgi:molybdate transport system permease protein